MNNNILKIYGISQNPDTKDFILVRYFENCCEKCYENYTNAYYKWCKPCQIKDLKNNFINWTSGNRQIDNFIQEKQLEINDYNDILFEWIPYNQFYEIKEIGKNNF